jgi:hypothetical protein
MNLPLLAPHASPADFTSHRAQWRWMATVELAAAAPDVSAVLQDLRYDFRLVEAAASPPGYRWLHLYVDACRGERRCILSTRCLLGALKRLAEIGELQHLRIIAGEQWLDESEIARGTDEDRPAAGALAPAPHAPAHAPRRRDHACVPHAVLNRAVAHEWRRQPPA